MLMPHEAGEEEMVTAESNLSLLPLTQAFVARAGGTFMTGKSAMAAESKLPSLPLRRAFVARAGVAVVEIDFDEVYGECGCCHWGMGGCCH